MLGVKPHEYFRVTDASTGGRTDNKLYRFFVIRGKFLPRVWKIYFLLSWERWCLVVWEGNDMPGELILKVADNGRYGRTRFVEKPFELKKGEVCNLMMIYPQYKGDLNGGARMGYKLERDGMIPLRLIRFLSVSLSWLLVNNRTGSSKYGANASTGLDRKKIQALWGQSQMRSRRSPSLSFPKNFTVELPSRIRFL